MCVLIYCEDRAISDEEFKEAWTRNRDGFGYAFRKNDSLYFKKGMMDKDKALEEYNKVKHILPHIVHFRLGSPVVPELTHPFLVTENSELIIEGTTQEPLLFHNGVVSGWDKWLMPIFLKLRYIPEGNWSDTRLVAIICKLLGKEALKYIEGKFIMMTTKEIFISGKFENKEDGLIASNTSYKPSKFYSNYSYSNISNTNRSEQNEFFL